jgi:hypothetical protein
MNCSAQFPAIRVSKKTMEKGRKRKIRPDITVGADFKWKQELVYLLCLPSINPSLS